MFCAIVAGRAAAHRLVEDEHTVSFLNIAPATVGHALVVPRRHAEGLWDLEDEEHARVARMASRVARMLRGALEPAGVNLVHATGAAAWQSVLHSTSISSPATGQTNSRSCGRRHPSPTRN
jgi:histidine triad (HIT) family protein